MTTIKECSVEDCVKPRHSKGLCGMHATRLRVHGNVHHVQRIIGNREASFWSHVDKSSGCWNWTARLLPPGYGQFNVGGRMRPAHRVAYEMCVGPIPENHDIDHVCHNRSCVRPEHLRPATRKQNMENRLNATSTASGVRGVTWHSGKWLARVVHNQKIHRAGRFSTIEEASAAAKAKRIELFTHNNEDRIEN